MLANVHCRDLYELQPSLLFAFGQPGLTKPSVPSVLQEAGNSEVSCRFGIYLENPGCEQGEHHEQEHDYVRICGLGAAMEYRIG